jgi:heptaprenyl diphosphate synthase
VRSSRSLEPSERPMELTAAANAFLGATEDRLESVLTRAADGVAASDTLTNAARHLCIGGGGKRLRPLMVHHFGRAVGAAAEALLHVGVAAELVHSASLLHDDVVDQGMFRRGRPTVNALWGNIVAVMGGDLLLCVALDELASLDREVTARAVATVAEMTRATIGEVEARGDLSLRPEQLRAIAEGKTGALFAFCGAAAAMLAGKPEVARRFDTFGRHLGVAFQIADDLKDLTGGDPGKPPFADIRSRTPSLPLLLAAASDEDLRRCLKELWAFGSMPDERVREVGQAVLASPAMGEARAELHLEITRGLDALGAYAQEPGGEQLVAWTQALGEAFEEGTTP